METKTVNKNKTENKTETKVEPKKSYYSKTILSVRRKSLKPVLPGEDVLTKKEKLGSALTAKGTTLSGFDSFEESKKYMPYIVDTDIEDNNFRKACKEYWSNISVNVPHDDESGDERYPGLKMEFEIEFKSEEDKKAYDTAINFERKAKICKEKGYVVDGISDYILFRYCLVYNQVANDRKDLYKSNKIRFYLYSKEKDVKTKHLKYQKVKEARKAFFAIEENEDKINAIIRLFNSNPSDVLVYPSIEDKILYLDKKIETNPSLFISYVKDSNLFYKGLIKEATDKGLLKNPDNTEIYYYGEENEVKLGNTLSESVSFIKSKGEVNQQVFDSLVTNLNYTPLKSK